jgi:DNA ligase D-like protein (predicted 3'-phosphoesterase)
MIDQLTDYRRKRNFAATREPKGIPRRSGRRHIFVVQKHRASHLHYDFRLEIDGVLKSWAVPKGPSLNPADRRLAVRVEDHPYEYKNFEGEIPRGQYGAGDVIVWDRGSYRLADGGDEAALQRDLRKGALSLILRGKKLRGGFSLIRPKRPRQWLLIKKRDAFAAERDITRNDRSVKSGRRLPDRRPAGGKVHSAARRK